MLSLGNSYSYRITDSVIKTKEILVAVGAKFRMTNGHRYAASRHSIHEDDSVDIGLHEARSPGELPTGNIGRESRHIMTGKRLLGKKEPVLEILRKYRVGVREKAAGDNPAPVSWSRKSSTLSNFREQAWYRARARTAIQPGDSNIFEDIGSAFPEPEEKTLLESEPASRPIGSIALTLYRSAFVPWRVKSATFKSSTPSEQE
ncbi:hypothetical protein AAE478_002154 [Parahypoxylon ruwenzoriense]